MASLDYLTDHEQCLRAHKVISPSEIWSGLLRTTPKPTPQTYAFCSCHSIEVRRTNIRSQKARTSKPEKAQHPIVLRWITEKIEVKGTDATDALEDSFVTS